MVKSTDHKVVFSTSLCQSTEDSRVAGMFRLHCAVHDGQSPKESDSECKIPLLDFQNTAFGKKKNYMYCLMLVNFDNFPIIRKCVKLIRHHLRISYLESLLPYMRPFWKAALKKTLPKDCPLLYAHVTWQMWAG